MFLLLFFFFFGISNENFIENEDGFMFTMMNTKYLNKLKKHQVENLKQYWNSKMELKICKKPQAREKKSSKSTRISNDQDISQHPKTSDYSVLSTLSTSSMPAPYSTQLRIVSQTSFSNQIIALQQTSVKKWVEFFFFF